MLNRIDELVNRSVDRVLSEAKKKGDDEKPALTKSQKNASARVQNYMKELVRKGDQEVLDTLRTMGYNSGISPQEMRQYRTQAYGPNLTIGDKVNDDAKRVARILSQYVMGDSGRIDFEGLKRDYPDQYGEILRMKHFLDRNSLTRLYDRSASMPTHPYGVDFENGGSIDDLNFNEFSDAELQDYIDSSSDKTITDDEALAKKRKSLIDQYLEYKYGLTVDIPSISYSLGNSKLPSNTLIVNFTSAHGCPAWNECLVKHACYARGIERFRDNVYRANENKTVYWLKTQNDPQLLRLMLDMVRAFVFDYNAIAIELLQKKLIKKPANGVDDLGTLISRHDLTSEFYTPKVKEIVMKHRRAEQIRLNENGDFIGQWLVDAWEQEAGKYKEFGVNVSAYTCRHLNFEGIKNLILNVSKTTISSGENAKGVARHFIAVPEEVYDALDETYGGQNNALALIKGSVNPNIQPLYNIVTMEDGRQVGQPNGKYYYKCPCERKIGSTSVNCYECNFCYQPKAGDEEMYVFVKAHGGAKTSLKGYDLLNCSIGVSQNFFTTYEARQKKTPRKRKTVKESVEDTAMPMLQQAEMSGIQGVTRNAINSTYQHFMGLANSMNESRVVRLTEHELIELIQDTVKKIL